LLKDGKGGGKQSMGVKGLRNAFAVLGRRREAVAGNNRDAVEEVGQDTRGKEPGQTAADDQSLATSVLRCSDHGFAAARHGGLPFVSSDRNSLIRSECR